MPAETDLATLVRSMSARLDDGAYVFTVVSGEAPTGVHPIVAVREAEGLTLVVAQDDADAHGLAYDFVAAWITLRVHSALQAVGLTAVVSGALADAGISCNVVAAFFHDHLFVPHDRADEAMRVLRSLTV